MLKITNSVDTATWSAFVNAHPSGNVFQTPEMYDIFRQVTNYEPVVLAAFDDRDRISGLLAGVIQKEHRGIIGRFTARTIVWGGPLVDPSTEAPGELAGLLIGSLVSQVRRRSVYIEFRNLAEPVWNTFFTNFQFRYLPYINCILSLEGKSVEDILSGMKYNRRREIRLSSEEGAVYGEAVSLEEVRAFYDILLDLYLHKVKVPLPDFEMFDAMYRSKAGKIFVVRHLGKVIGGAACLLFGNKTLYTLYYCGKRNYHPRIFPTHLAVLAAIEYGIGNGFSSIDLMGAGKSDVAYGVREYKAHFGCELPEYGRFLRINNPFIYRLGKYWIHLHKSA